MDAKELDELWGLVERVGEVDHLDYDAMLALGHVFGRMRAEIERLQKVEVYQILTIDDPQIIDFTFYTDEESVQKRVSELNKLAKHSVYWYITLYLNHRNLGNDGGIGEVEED